MTIPFGVSGHGKLFGRCSLRSANGRGTARGDESDTRRVFGPFRQRYVTWEELTRILSRGTNVAERYSAGVGHDSDPIYRRSRDFLWRHLGNDLTGLDVLDLGCGHGWLAEMCRARGAWPWPERSSPAWSLS